MHEELARNISGTLLIKFSPIKLPGTSAAIVGGSH